MKTKICVPIVAQVSFSILAKAEELSSLPIDAVEWRVDYFAGNQDEIPGVIMRLKDVLNEKKLIVTLRTVEEGGEENGARFDYFSVIRGVIDQGMADYVDIELDRDEESLKSMIALSGSSDTKIIGSYHDFESMPDEDFIYDKLTYARDMGCDMGKVSCMAKCYADSERLLFATERFHKMHGKYPIATMAMGDAGYITRLYGGLYGSCLTFASSGKSSAPGQRSVEEVINASKIFENKPGHIILIGFMGTGKTTISKILSDKYGIPETDTDHMIIKKTGKQISEIFDEDGEETFRRVETDILDELGKMKRSVVSCGGGTVLRDINVKKLKNFGTIVLLTAEPETVYKRIHMDKSRPLLQGKMNVGYISELMDKRRAAYEGAADVVVSTDGRHVVAIADEIWNG